MIAWVFLRFVAAWVFTLWMGIWAGFLMVCVSPTRGWIWSRLFWARTTLRLIGVRLDVLGGERLRVPGVYICNHVSLIDVVVMPALVPKMCKIVAKKELKKIPFWGWSFAKGGAILIDRKNPKEAIMHIRQAVKALPEGWSVLVFPEGTRSVDGRLKKFKKGAFHIAIETGLPVIPVGLDGVMDVVPKGGWLTRPTCVAVTVGEPVYPEGVGHEGVEAFVQKCHDEVAKCVAVSVERRAGFLRA
jgi:1-acyl-sn-glycerol-3-phosphate acyltransferase